MTLLIAALASAKASADPAASPTRSGEFMFSLVPKAFQKNPVVYLTVITEMTPEGKRVAPPTAAQPAYYVAQSSGYHDEGLGVLGERPLPVAELDHELQTSLSSSHYLPAPPGHPATLVLIFVWGSHNKLDEDAVSQVAGDPAASIGTRDPGHANLLSRAALVAGIKFAHDLEKVLAEQDKLVATGAAGFGPTPLEIFADRDDKTRELLSQVSDDCTYVVVSAYDGASLAKGKRNLLWRTKMTTNSRGVSMGRSLPTLIATGAPYFGKDMTEPATLERRQVPNGRVDVGAPVVVPDQPKRP